MSAHARYQIALDTETTGLEAANGDRIIEIGCVRIDGRIIRTDAKDNLQIFVNPERDIPEEAVAIHGITNEKVANCPVFADIADQFIEFIRGAELLIHNAEFDTGFLNMELARCGKGKLEDYVVAITDTIPIAKKKKGGAVNLDLLCEFYGVDRSKRTFHGALLDAQLLAEVYVAMTRDQSAMDFGELNANNSAIPAPEFFKVIRATPEELAEHEKILDKADKQSKSVCAWRKLNAPAEEPTAE